MSVASAATAAALRAEGLSITQVAAQLGVSKTTIMRWTNPEYAERSRAAARALKERYRGTCLTCGGRTTGCKGPDRAPTECGSCMAARLHDERYWTKERVVAAIRQWAATHDGTPPTATDWLHAQTIGGCRYPNCQSVYRSVRRSTSPFAFWADAIEAAGFPRPRVGQYDTELRKRPKVSTETLLQRIRDASEDGIAPTTRLVTSAYRTLLHRGIPWTRACEMAGVTLPRRSGPRPA